MLKFLTAYPFTRNEISDAGTSVSANKIVSSMNSNLNNMLEDHISKFGFDGKAKKLPKDSTGPGMQNSPE